MGGVVPIDLSKKLPPRVIRASAGTGKTYELSGQFLTLLALGEKPDRILATTFTRKAAGEIRDRIFRRLAEAVLSIEAAATIARDLKLEKFSPENAAALLKELVQSQHRLRICTLDSFFSQIASSFSFELGLGADWAVADEWAHDILKSDTVRRLCESEDPKALSTLLILLNEGKLRRSVHERLRGMVNSLYPVFRITNEAAWKWLNSRPPVSDKKREALIGSFRDLPLPLNKDGIPDQRLEGARASLLQEMAVNDWKAFLSETVVANTLSGNGTYYKKPIPGDYREALKALAAVAKTEVLNNLAYRTGAMYDLLKLFDREFEKSRLSRALFGFDDLKYSLASASFFGSLTEVFYRLDGRIAHLLLDEFQDTSMSEWQVVEPLASEILDQSSESRTFFCVGDVKQAIYGWRGGVSEILDYIPGRWDHIKPLTQETSWRSAPAVIECVNRVFGGIAGNPALDNYRSAAAEWGTRFKAHATHKKDRKGFVTLLRMPDNAAVSVARRAAELVAEIREKAPEASVGVLVRRNSAVSEILYELNTLPVPVRASGEGGSPLDDSPAVSAILSLLRAADHPGDTISRFHVSQTALGRRLQVENWNDGERWETVLRELRGRVLLHGLGVTLHELALPLEAESSVRDYRRLRQLVALGYGFDAEESTLRLQDFVERVERQKVEDPEASRVRVMTIHKAKGLEFDVVVLPELDNDLGRKSGDLLWYTEKPLEPPLRVVAYADKAVRALDEHLEQAHECCSAAKMKEALSGLYVALTRPRTALYMLIDSFNPKRVACSYAGILRSALAEDKLDEILFEDGDKDWMNAFRKAGGEKTAAKALPPLELELTAPEKRTRGLTRQAPSSLEGGEKVDVARMLKIGTKHYARRGHVIHTFFSLIGWLEDGVPDENALAAAAAALQVPREEAASLIKEFTRMVRSEGVSKALRRSSYETRGCSNLSVRSELAFSYPEEDSLISGAIDRLVTGTRKDGSVFAEVIDFKTDQIADDAALMESREYYRPQIDVYKRAARRFENKAKEVEGRLLFVGAGKEISV